MTSKWTDRSRPGGGPTEFLAGRNYIGHYHIVDVEVDFSVTPSYSGVTLKFTMW